MPDADASLAAAREAQKVVAHLNGEGSQDSSPNPFHEDDEESGSMANARESIRVAEAERAKQRAKQALADPINPFHAAAVAEAKDDSLIGIERNDEWIRKRGKELYEASRAQATAENRPEEFIPRRELIATFRRAVHGHLDEQTNAAAAKIVQEQIDAAIIKDRAERPISDVIKDMGEKQIKAKVEELELKSYKERLRSATMSLLFIRSCMFVILIPIIGMFPSPWNSLQVIPVIIVAWLNWKPVREIHRVMKNIENERIKPEKKSS